jgi:galactose mutarotase-like enzyme
VLNGNGLKLAAEVQDEQSGTKMKVFTTEKCLVFYTGSYFLINFYFNTTKAIIWKMD